MGPPVRREDPVDPAAEELYGAPLSQFTAVRKRLADALRSEGDRSLATRVAALARPTMAAWVVNQLWRRARGDVDELMAAGQKMKRGEPGAWQEQRAALARLAAEASEVLREDRHAASPATLRRVTATLQALSAVGSFAPDQAGRLVADRDPPGFEVLGDEDGTAAAAVAAAATPASPSRRGASARVRERIADEAEVREQRERSRADGRAAIERARAAAREKADRERQADKARSRAASLGRTIDRLRAETEELEEKLAARQEALRAAEQERDEALAEAERAAQRRRSRS